MYRKNEVVLIYMSVQNEIIIIPTKCNGAHQEALPFRKFDIFDEKEIGNCIKEMFLLIYKNKVELPENNEKVYQIATGIKSYPAFSRKHLCVSVTQFYDNNEYLVSNEPRQKKGGYGVVDDESKKFATEYILNKDCSDGELGIAVKTAFSDGQKYIEFQNRN